MNFSDCPRRDFDLFRVQRFKFLEIGDTEESFFSLFSEWFGRFSEAFELLGRREDCLRRSSKKES